MYPPYTAALTDERSQQVEELLRQHPGARPINPDRTVIDLPIELRHGKATALRITLPPHFPQERPAISVLVPVVCPAVDAGGRLQTSLGSNWVYGSSRLSHVVTEAAAILRDGEAAGAAAAAAAAANTAAAAAAGGGGGSGGGGTPSVVPFPAGYPVPPRAQSASPQRRAMQQHHQQPPLGPATSSALPDFSRYTPQQLEELMRDQDAFKALLQEAIKGSPMAATLEEIRVKNRQLAESNLSKQTAINEVRNQLAIVRSSEYTLIKSRFDELLARQTKVLSTTGGVVWREKLEEAVSASDAGSCTLVADFLAGSLPLDTFVGQHVELRAQHHALDLKRQAAETLLASADGGGAGSRSV